MNKIAVFADIQNIYYTTRQVYQRQFNYRELWTRISREGEIVKANAYAIEREVVQQYKFQSASKHNGVDIML